MGGKFLKISFIIINEELTAGGADLDNSFECKCGGIAFHLEEKEMTYRNEMKLEYVLVCIKCSAIQPLSIGGPKVTERPTYAEAKKWFKNVNKADLDLMLSAGLVTKDQVIELYIKENNIVL